MLKEYTYIRSYVANSYDMGIKLRWDNTVTVMHQCIAIHNLSMCVLILQIEYQCIAVLINLISMKIFKMTFC